MSRVIFNYSFLQLNSLLRLSIVVGLIHIIKWRVFILLFCGKCKTIISVDGEERSCAVPMKEGGEKKVKREKPKSMKSKRRESRLKTLLIHCY